jgi:xanthine permease
MNANTDLRKRLADYHGDVPVAQALPYGIQHVLAMFVSNLAPIIIICAAAGLGTDDSAMLIQNAMIAAGIGTLIQLFGVWRVGAKMPIVMGLSFTFVTVLSGVAATYGMGAAVGAVIVGGCIEGVLGLFAKYWYKYIGNIVSAVVVVSIGFSLLSTGAETFAGGSSAADFGSWENLFLGAISLLACLLFQRFAKGSIKQLNILFGLAFGYIVALFMGKVDFSGFRNLDIISLPHLMPFAPEFNIGAIISMTLLFLVSAAETIGDTGAIARIGFDRNPSGREISGAVAADGFTSAIAGVFGCSPLTSFAQNIGLIGMTGVVNRRAIACGAAVLIIAGFVPAVSAVFSSVPNAVLGGCTIMMFGTIVTSGFQMVASAGFTQRNITIAATSLAIGIGFSQVSVIFASFPELVQNIFVNNSIALTFLVALVMNLVMPKEARPVVVADGDDARQSDNGETKDEPVDSQANADKAPNAAATSEPAASTPTQATKPAPSENKDNA